MKNKNRHAVALGKRGKGKKDEALRLLLKHWPVVHKVIRSDIPLGEAAESIHAIAEFVRNAK
jgi:hypothetical protein